MSSGEICRQQRPVFQYIYLSCQTGRPDTELDLRAAAMSIHLRAARCQGLNVSGKPVRKQHDHTPVTAGTLCSQSDPYKPERGFSDISKHGRSNNRSRNSFPAFQRQNLSGTLGMPCPLIRRMIPQISRWQIDQFLSVASTDARAIRFEALRYGLSMSERHVSGAIRFPSSRTWPAASQTGHRGL